MHETALACPHCGRPTGAARDSQPARWLGLSGRISRQTWWLYYVLPIFVASIVAWSLASSMPNEGVGALLYVCVSIFTTIASICGTVKRLHDRDMSGWWWLLNFVPLIGALVLLILVGFLRGTPGPNRFGDDPLASGRRRGFASPA